MDSDDVLRAELEKARAECERLREENTKLRLRVGEHNGKPASKPSALRSMRDLPFAFGSFNPLLRVT
jgi:hypothetical protein